MHWFLLLLLLNIIDILITNPVLEINPFTLFLWGRLGILLSAIVKIGLVLLFGGLCIISKKVAKPAEWHFIEKILKTILKQS